jgi:hypothetical protein
MSMINVNIISTWWKRAQKQPGIGIANFESLVEDILLLSAPNFFLLEYDISH